MKIIKKTIIFFLLIIAFNVNASEEISVKLKKCVDGDTAWFSTSKGDIKVRFLGIDAPESTNKKEPFGRDASNFTCKYLTNARKIYLEFDDEAERVDKYDRTLAWVFIDGELLQRKIVKNGYAKVAYIYGDYKYTNDLYDAQDFAKANKLNIWSTPTDYTGFIYLFIALVVVIYIFIPNKRKVIDKYITSEFKKLIKRSKK